MQNFLTMQCSRCSNHVEEWQIFSNACLHCYCTDCFFYLLEKSDAESKCLSACEECTKGFTEMLFDNSDRSAIYNSNHQENLTLQLSSIRYPINHEEPISQPGEDTLVENYKQNKCDRCKVKNSDFKCNHSICMDCYVYLIYPSILEACYKIYHHSNQITSPYCLGCIDDKCKKSYQSIPAEYFIDLLSRTERTSYYEEKDFVIQVMTAFLPLFNGVPMTIIECRHCSRPMGKLSSTDFNCQWCWNENFIS
ncbi:unnamed protein product [Blepharisma stoltei]|uniref:RING-type domain-containing protein n=1 Tax=Blepharisma stoltei TaxID=1481888 RepID=A0AAU9JN57_9CILI|nr:unnamed protein product [Blepharisma stoltei]